MWRDRWFALGVTGTMLAGLACLTPLAVVALGAIGLGAWAGYLDVILVPMLAAIDKGLYRRHEPREVVWSLLLGLVHLSETRKNLGVGAS